MKFSCEKLLLQNAVNTTSRAVAAKSSIPALEGLLLQCGDGVLTVRLFEDEGRADEIVLRAPFRPARAALTNLDGSVLGEAKIDGETVRFPVEAYRIAQVKLYR